MSHGLGSSAASRTERFRTIGEEPAGTDPGAGPLHVDDLPTTQLRRLAAGSVWEDLRARLGGSVWLLGSGGLVAGALLVAAGLWSPIGPSGRAAVLDLGVGMLVFAMTTLAVTAALGHRLERELLRQSRESLAGHLARTEQVLRRHAEQSRQGVQEHLGRQRDEVQATLVAQHQAVREVLADTRRSLEVLDPLVGNCGALGLTNVYLTRADALEDFVGAIREELTDAMRAPSPGLWGESTGEAGMSPRHGVPRLWISASSLKGLLETVTARCDGAGLLETAAGLARAGRLDLRILLTDREYARHRSQQENRAEGEISEDIRGSLRRLTAWNVPPWCVRTVRATPTVFAVATRDQMLINPYPYGAEAFRSFTLTVHRVSKPQDDFHGLFRDIFEQYEQWHFVMPWTASAPERQVEPVTSNGRPGGRASAHLPAPRDLDARERAITKRTAWERVVEARSTDEETVLARAEPIVLPEPAGDGAPAAGGRAAPVA